LSAFETKKTTQNYYVMLSQSIFQTYQTSWQLSIVISSDNWRKIFHSLAYQLFKD